ncbi:MAG: hypothetical protein K2O46_04250, partial [Bacteroidales bacterium]|nr:hypothetical protein [Bacteroidales bacterium]
MKRWKLNSGAWMVCLLISMVSVQAQTDSPTDENVVWTHVNKNYHNQMVVDVHLGRTADEFGLDPAWADVPMSYNPVIIGDDIYFINTTIENFSVVLLGVEHRKINGEFVGRVDMTDSYQVNGRPCQIVYGDGKLFVATDRFMVFAYDAESLKPLWQKTLISRKSLEDVYASTAVSPLLYDNGRLYAWFEVPFGHPAYPDECLWNMGLSRAEDILYCLDAADGNPATETEENAILWAQRVNHTQKGISLATIVNGNIYVPIYKRDNTIYKDSSYVVGYDGATGQPIDTLK